MQIIKKTNLKGYKKALELGPGGIIDLLLRKNVTGRGGAGFPTGKKWEMVYQAKADKKYIICNADEGEPGTFKDKFIFLNNPEAVIEGILIAAHTIKTKNAIIYLRGEYEYLKDKIQGVINRVCKKLNSKVKIEIYLGAGAYVCGDETAIMESIENQRGHPRFKPPYPTIEGLYGKPTIINNVETFANVSLALAFDDYDSTLRLYSLSGNVSSPGIYELHYGIKMSDLVKLGKPKNKVKAIFFGCFGGCLPYSELPLTNENVCGQDCMLGANTIIVVDEKQSMVDVTTNIAKFYEFESCGKCTPCREGSMRVLALLQNISLGEATKKDFETLKELTEVIKESSFCGLGQNSMNHIITAIKYFEKEFLDKLK